MRKLRVLFKLIRRRFVLVDSFCRDCGVDIRDFVASDELWFKVMGDTQKTVCYNCFCDRSKWFYKIEEGD